ncbi:hypothetical protein [Winogradskyella sp.]|uniref:hypothetical protein n=1 Tax=Winogradskyella sp. TaxID=1883156 RepID=UPI00261041E0|nr:hypothetical protein [Winogradskyella sp.]
MKRDYNQFKNHSLLYIIISEMVFLHEALRLTDYLANRLQRFYSRIKTAYVNLLKNVWVEASLMLSGFMAASTLILLIAYKLVMIY